MGDPFSGVEAFVAACEARSFSRGASRLGVSPAAVSKAVSRLEEELSVRLLDRTTRRVELTREGEIYLQHCRLALDEVTRGRQRIEQARSVAEGELVVSLPAVLGASLIERLPAFMEAYPALSVRLTLSDRVSKSVDEQIDVALRIGALGEQNALCTKLSQLSWVTVASKSYLVRRGRPSKPADLLDHECLVYRSPKGYELNWTFLEKPPRPETRTLARPARLIFDDGALLVRGAVAGLGVAQVFSFMVRGELASDALVELLPDYAAPGPALCALVKPGQGSVAKVRAFLDFAHESYR